MSLCTTNIKASELQLGVVPSALFARLQSGIKVKTPYCCSVHCVLHYVRYLRIYNKLHSALSEMQKGEDSQEAVHAIFLLQLFYLFGLAHNFASVWCTVV